MSIMIIAIVIALVFLATFVLGEWLARDGAAWGRRTRKRGRSADSQRS